LSLRSVPFIEEPIMDSLTQRIESRTEEIIAHWQEWLGRAGVGIGDPEGFIQAARPLLAEIAARGDELFNPTGTALASARWWPQSYLMPAVRAYATARRAAGAEASLIAREWQLLRAALWHALAADFGALAPKRAIEAQVALNYAFDDALAQTVVAQQLGALAAALEQSRAAERAAFNHQLAVEVERAARYGRTCSLTILDIDHLRSVNEKLGHERGDRLLEEINSLLRSQLRQADRTFRYGGDEFVAILPETDFALASAVMGRIGERATRFCREAALPPEVGVHWGIATFPDDAEEAKALFLLADNRLRESKRRTTASKPTFKRRAGATLIGLE
jgi:diguanylate cyclase (GGDEF)-like protein